MSASCILNSGRILAASALAMLTVGGAIASLPGEAVAAAPEEMKAEYVRPTEVPFPEENPYTKEKADLGHKLFFDPRLSGANYISCGTCHNPSFAWGDGLPVGIGNDATRLARRTPTILNAAFGEMMMWDGRFETLEEQAVGPMAAEAEMNQELEAIAEELRAIPGYVTLFEIAFPGEGITVENAAKAIATFERTIVSGVAPFDRWIAGDESAISESAKRGFELFNQKANCVACHSSWRFTDDSFHDIGLESEDIGRGKELPKIEKMQYAFKTPTLRNVVERAPYMHDGSMATLTEVVEHYNEGGIKRPSLSDDMRPLGLSEKEVEDLVAFMLTLSSQDDQIALPTLPPADQSPVAALGRTSPAAGGNGDKASKPSDPCRLDRLHLRTCK